jgi:hypothetical protein
VQPMEREYACIYRSFWTQRCENVRLDSYFWRWRWRWVGFQSRANHLSASLDDLKKTLYERGRALGVKPKSAVPVEVSTGTYRHSVWLSVVLLASGAG